MTHCNPGWRGSDDGWTRYWRAGFWIVALALALTACTPEPDSPETEIRAFVARAQTAAENRDLSALRALIAADYTDEQGNDRKAVENLMRLHILRNQSIHLLTRIRSIEFPEPGYALVSVAAAMAGRPIASADALVGLTADLYRFDLELIRQGRDDWQVQRAAWTPAQLEEFW